MALSDAEIKRLAEKAESYRDSAFQERTGLKQLQKALQCYDQIIESLPDHPYYFYKRASVKYQLWGIAKDKPYLEDAIHDLDEAIKLDPDNGSYYRARGLYRLEDLADRKGSIELEKAMQIRDDFRACVSRDPSQSEIWLHQLAFSVILQDWDDAISLYGQCRAYMESQEDTLLRSYFGCLALAFAGDPIEQEDIAPLQAPRPQTDSRLLEPVSRFVGRFVLEYNDRQRKQNINEINQLLLSHIESQFSQGLLFQGFCDYEKALKAYEKELDITPNHVAAWTNKGLVCGELGLSEKAIESYNKAIELQPENVTPVVNKVLLLVKLDLDVEAQKVLDEALKSHPNDSRLLEVKALLTSKESKNIKFGDLKTFKKAWCLLDMADEAEKSGNYKEALEIYDKAIELQPDLAPAWRRKARCLLDMADEAEESGKYQEALEFYDKAIEICEKAIEQTPEHAKELARPLLSKANCLKHLERTAEAVEACDKYIELVPEPPHQILGMMSLIYWANGNEDRGREYAVKAEMRGANKAEEWGDYEEALEKYDFAIMLKPDHAEAWKNKIWCLYNLERIAEAVEACEKYTELNREDAATWYGMAVLYSLNGNSDDAIGSLAKAIKIDSSYREEALKDEEFKSLWKNKKFKQLVSTKRAGKFRFLRNLFGKGSNK